MRKRYIVYLAALGAVMVLSWYMTREDPIAVTLASVERGGVEETVSNTRAGTIEACRRAKMSPSMGGQIAFLGVTEGETVKTGQLLAELWNEDIKAEIALAESELESTTAKATAACLHAEVSRREADRLSSLRQRGAASEETVDKAETEALASAADCLAARSTVEVSRSKVSVAKAKLDKTRLLAPFPGVVAEINGELNEYVTPSPPGIPTLPVVDLIDNSCFYVSAPIDEVDVARVNTGMPARITLDACGDTVFPGTVRRIAPYVLDLAKQARTVDVEVEFDDPDIIGSMLAGYSADVEIVLSTRSDSLRIPTESVVDDDKVFVLVDGVLEKRTISTGMTNWDFTEVTEGLAIGDRVVTSVDREGIEEGALAVEDDAAP